jgi:hypothetical protein
MLSPTGARGVLTCPCFRARDHTIFSVLSGQRTWWINKWVHVTLKENDSATYLVEQELSALEELQGYPEPTNPEFSLTRS